MVQVTDFKASGPEADFRDVLKMISYLLQYPNKEWLHIGDLTEEVSQLVDEDSKASLLTFLQEISEYSLEQLEAHFVNVFDFNDKRTLYLSYLKAGEQRERGMILVELKTLYNEYGFTLTDEELSDFLPVVLEFASVAPLTIACNLLNSFLEMIEQLVQELGTIDSVYQSLLTCCLTVSKKMILVKVGD